MALEIGDRVGDYQIIRELGAGGMGKVYEVRNLISDRTEAMKVLLPDLAGNAELAERFLREIKVQARLEHPNIACLHTAQQVDNRVLMFMEFVEGNSVDQLLRRGKLRLDYGLNFMAQVLSALDYAHQSGVVHRDLKPANIMVMPSGQVKLMDFGIAKLAADRKLTSTGHTMGSLYYMSPEQIQNSDSVDARSDVYSIGICLYEIATGKRPFDAASEYSLMSAHLHDAPRPPVELDPTLPLALNQIILMAIAKQPEQRFQSAGAMLGALNNVRKELGLLPEGSPTTIPVSSMPAVAAVPPAAMPQAPPPGQQRRSGSRGLYIAVGALATAALLVLGLWVIPKYLVSSGASPQTPSPNAALPVTPEPAASTPPSTAPAAQPTPPATQSPDAISGNSPVAAVPVASPPSRAGTPALGRSAPNQTVQQSTPVAAAQVPEAVQQAPAPQQIPGTGSPAPPTTSTAQTAAAPVSAALNEVREQYNRLAIRVATAKGGLESLQRQMGGLGLRADMREASTRADYLMGEAMSAIRTGDVETARRNLDLADRTTGTIEKFLGR